MVKYDNNNNYLLKHQVLGWLLLLLNTVTNSVSKGRLQERSVNCAVR